MKSIRVHIEPPDGHLWVSAPHRTLITEIEAMIRRRLDRIRTKQALVRARSVVVGGDDFEKGRVQILGREYQIVTELETSGSVRIEGSFLIVPGVASEDRDGIVRAVEAFRIEALRSEISKFMLAWESTVGKTATWWGIRRMSTRWGSCSVATRRIRFSASLAQRDLALIEYVVLHELAHLIVPNHGPAFVALMNHHMPDWQRRRLALRGDSHG